MWGIARKKPVNVQYREVQPMRYEDIGGKKIGVEVIRTLEGLQNAFTDRDFIIKGVEGELYPIKKHIFKKTYDVIESINNGGVRSK